MEEFYLVPRKAQKTRKCRLLDLLDTAWPCTLCEMINYNSYGMVATYLEFAFVRE